MQSLQAQAQAIADRYQPPSTGRPSDIGDATLLQQLFDAIAAGNYMETACDLVGISVASIHNWKKRGEAGEAPYDRFLEALKRASAQAEARAVANVLRASEIPAHWPAGMTYLERRHPERWGKRQDDSNTPRVVVNIGVGMGDVKVGIQTFASTPSDLVPLSPLEAKEDSDANSLSHKTYAELSSPITAVMMTPAQPPATVSAREIPAVESEGGPYPVALGPAQFVGGVADQSASVPVGRGQRKKRPLGRSASRAGASTRRRLRRGGQSRPTADGSGGV